MQLRQSIPVGVEDHHATGLRHVHADFDDGGGHQNRCFPGFEIGHDLRLRRVVVTSGQCGYADAGELRQRSQSFRDFHDGVQWRPLFALRVVLAQIVCLVERGANFRILRTGRRIRVLGIRVDTRADHVGALPRVDTVADQSEHLRHERTVLLRHDKGADRLAAARKLGKPGDIKVAEPGHGGGAWNRRGRHDQQMRGRGAFAVQRFALLHAEAMLFVDHRQREVGRLERLGERGVCGHHDARLAGGGRGEHAPARGELHAAGEQQHRNIGWPTSLIERLSTVRRCRSAVHADLSTFVHNRVVRCFSAGFPGLRAVAHTLHHAANAIVMLFGQHLRRRHQYRLFAGADGLHHRGDRHHGLAGADLALQQTLHGVIACHVRGDVVDDPLLPIRQRERQRRHEIVLQTGVDADRRLGLA